jgi:cobalt-precorrin-5B (C1)-methyltransferase
MWRRLSSTHCCICPKMDEFCYESGTGKKLRKGYTTGSCAAGAAKAAVYLLCTGRVLDHVVIDTPGGEPLTLPVTDCRSEGGIASCSIVKDAGDDPDVTDGMKIFAEVSLLDGENVVIEAGEGIGRVTLSGLKIPVGRPAINPVPLQMIEKEVRLVLSSDKGARIILSVPGGEERAEKTFNSKLGIVGGISILGTTGIVEPMSQEALKESLALKLSVMASGGLTQAIFVFGNYGEAFSRENLGVDGEHLVKIGNYIGFMLDKALEYDFREILIVGHLGKLVKVAAGIFQTHSRVADARAEILCAYAALAGAPQEVVKKIYECPTTESAVEVMERFEVQIYPQIAARVVMRCQEYVRQKIEIGAVLFNGADHLLAMDGAAEKIIKELKT